MPQAFAALGAAALNFGMNQASSAINSSRQWKYTRRAMEYQDQLNRAFNQWSLENNPTFSRKGYVDAGYNPLLALGSQLTSQTGPVGPSASLSDSDQGDQAVNSAINALNLNNTLKLGSKQADNIEADTDVKRFGQRGAIIKNLLTLADKNKKNPVVQKLVDSEIVKLNPQFAHSAIDSQFYKNHPTTADVLRKFKQGDFRGAKYAIDQRRKRILKEMNGSHSSISALKKTKFADSLEYANSQKAPTPSEIRSKKVVSRNNPSTRLRLPQIPY